VHERARRQGIAGKLMAHLEIVAREQGKRYWY
jgi:GNAT superfamily N-acetyltransferase